MGIHTSRFKESFVKIKNRFIGENKHETFLYDDLHKTVKENCILDAQNNKKKYFDTVISKKLENRSKNTMEK